jgi:amidase
VVVTGQADMALGGDQGGSIRLPASWSGCCGHKPTYGLVPYTGIFPIELTIDHTGPMARTVAECALMLDVIAGEDGLDPRQANVRVEPYAEGLDRGADGLRVGVLREGFELPGLSEPAVDAAVREAVERLTGAGATVEEVSVPMHRDGLAIWNGIAIEGATDLMVRGDAFGTNHKGHYTTDLVDFYGRARRVRAQDYSVTVKLTMLLGHYLSDRYNHHYYAKAQNLGRRLRAAYGEALERYDVLALPTTPMTAMRIPPPGAPIADVLTAALSNIANTAPIDVTGNPALSVPCAFADGLPVGLMLVGRHFDDATVLRAGRAFEAVRGELGAGSEVGAVA